MAVPPPLPPRPGKSERPLSEFDFDTPEPATDGAGSRRGGLAELFGPAGSGRFIVVACAVSVVVVVGIIGTIEVSRGMMRERATRRGSDSAVEKEEKVSNTPTVRADRPTRLTLTMPERVPRLSLVEIKVEVPSPKRKQTALIFLPDGIKLPPGEQLVKEVRSRGEVKWRAKALEVGHFRVQVESGGERVSGPIEVRPESP